MSGARGDQPGKHVEVLAFFEGLLGCQRGDRGHEL